MKVSFIRHGEARYGRIDHQDSFDTGVTDLKESGLEKVRSQAREFADKLTPTDVVTVWSSPIPRAIETANIFTEELNGRGVLIRKRKLFAIFEEARRFRWEYLRGMVEGWVTLIEWSEVTLDRSITNPLGLSYAEYFQQSAWKKIPEEYRISLGNAGTILYDIETFDGITKRIFRELQRLQRADVGKNNHILIFTHQCNTDFITQILNNYMHGGLNTGENVTLEKTRSPHGAIDFSVIDFPQEIPAETRSQGVVQGTLGRFGDIVV